jgi:hypothetical protein
MADYYVRNTGDDSKTGLSWANARQTLQSFFQPLPSTFVKPGDTIWVAHDTFEDWWPGLGVDATYLSPPFDWDGSDGGWRGGGNDLLRIISCDDTGDPEPPTTWQAGARFQCNSYLAIVLGGPVYIYGMTFEATEVISFQSRFQYGPTSYPLTGTPAYPFCGPFVAENCTFKTIGSTNPATLKFGLAARYETGSIHVRNHDYFFKDCTFNLTNIYSRFLAYGLANGVFENCTLTCSASLTGDPIIVHNFANLEFYGCDLSGCPSSKYIIGYAPAPELGAYTDVWSEAGSCHVLINRCKLPSSFMGCFRPTSTTYPFAGDDHVRGEMYYSANSGTPDTRIFEWASLRGNARGETVIKRTGGADNGTGGYSIKVVTPGSGLGAPGPYFPFCLKPLRFYCFETGTKTFTFELIYDYATADLTDRDVWVELLHMGAAVPGTVTRSLPHQLSGATALPSGVGIANWTYTGLTQPKSQKVSVTATIDHEQILEFQIKVGKPGRTIYIDPLVVVT